MDKAHVAAMQSAQGNTYFEARCVDEHNLLLGEALDQPTAQHIASQHSLQTGHETTVTEKPRG